MAVADVAAAVAEAEAEAEVVALVRPSIVV